MTVRKGGINSKAKLGPLCFNLYRILFRLATLYDKEPMLKFMLKRPPTHLYQMESQTWAPVKGIIIGEPSYYPTDPVAQQVISRMLSKGDFYKPEVSFRDLVRLYFRQPSRLRLNVARASGSGGGNDSLPPATSTNTIQTSPPLPPLRTGNSPRAPAVVSAIDFSEEIAASPSQSSSAPSTLSELTFAFDLARYLEEGLHSGRRRLYLGRHRGRGGASDSVYQDENDMDDRDEPAEVVVVAEIELDDDMVGASMGQAKSVGQVESDDDGLDDEAGDLVEAEEIEVSIPVSPVGGIGDKEKAEELARWFKNRDKRREELKKEEAVIAKMDVEELIAARRAEYSRREKLLAQQDKDKDKDNKDKESKDKTTKDKDKDRDKNSRELSSRYIVGGVSGGAGAAGSSQEKRELVCGSSPRGGGILIAHPLANPRSSVFADALVVLQRHDKPVGVVVNRPWPCRAYHLWPTLKLTQILAHNQVHWGGPLAGERLLPLFIHRFPDIPNASMLCPGVYLNMVRGEADEAMDAVERLVASNKAQPNDFKILAGWAGWMQDQLEGEYKRNFWFAAEGPAVSQFATQTMLLPPSSTSKIDRTRGLVAAMREGAVEEKHFMQQTFNHALSLVGGELEQARLLSPPLHTSSIISSHNKQPNNNNTNQRKQEQQSSSSASASKQREYQRVVLDPVERELDRYMHLLKRRNSRK